MGGQNLRFFEGKNKKGKDEDGAVVESGYIAGRNTSQVGWHLPAPSQERW